MKRNEPSKYQRFIGSCMREVKAAIEDGSVFGSMLGTDFQREGNRLILDYGYIVPAFEGVCFVLDEDVPPHQAFELGMAVAHLEVCDVVEAFEVDCAECDVDWVW